MIIDEAWRARWSYTHSGLHQRTTYSIATSKLKSLVWSKYKRIQFTYFVADNEKSYKTIRQFLARHQGTPNIYSPNADHFPFLKDETTTDVIEEPTSIIVFWIDIFSQVPVPTSRPLLYLTYTWIVRLLQTLSLHVHDFDFHLLLFTSQFIRFFGLGDTYLCTRPSTMFKSQDMMRLTTHVKHVPM